MVVFVYLYALYYSYFNISTVVYLLQKVLHLNEMFWVGQPVVTQVLEIGEKVKLSMMPEAVQSDWSSRSLTVGSVIVAAVSSCEERGYIMETGIANVRAFLKSSAAEEYINKWNKGKQLGEPETDVF